MSESKRHSANENDPGVPPSFHQIGKLKPNNHVVWHFCCEPISRGGIRIRVNVTRLRNFLGATEFGIGTERGTFFGVLHEKPTG